MSHRLIAMDSWLIWAQMTRPHSESEKLVKFNTSGQQSRVRGWAVRVVGKATCADPVLGYPRPRRDDTPTMFSQREQTLEGFPIKLLFLTNRLE